MVLEVREAWLAQVEEEVIEPERRIVDEGQAENRRLKAELARVTEERDILKKAAAYFASECR